MIQSLNELIEKVSGLPPRVIAIAAPEGAEVLEVAMQAERLGLASFILVGDEEKIRAALSGLEGTLKAQIIDEKNHALAAKKAVACVTTGKAGAIMKGDLHTGTFLKAVLDKEKGLNLNRKISQISVFDKEEGGGLQMLTDCAMAIEPTLEEKKELIVNAVELAHAIGYEKPKVALLSAVEVINPKISDTLDAAVLSKMNDRGQIKGCVVDGPFALDNAISIEAARYKGVEGEVAGQADILVVPNLQVGNVLTKSLTYYAHKEVAAAVMGAGAPIVMTSRSDTIRNKLLSIALAAYISPSE